MVVGLLLGASSMVMLSQPVLAEGEMEIIDRIRPVGKVKISADRDVALVESLENEKTAEPVDQATEETNETVDEVIAAGSEPADTEAKVADEEVDKVEQTSDEATATAVYTATTSVTVNNELGEQVFKKNCFACHGTGIPNIPKVGDKEAWAPRIAQGEAVLVEHAMKGFNTMPPKGGNAALTDDEIKAAVDYLVTQGS
jgi:cytochrome c5